MAETRYIEGEGRYALAEMVGRGGFATVWRARELGGTHWGATFRSRDVAIKIIPVYSAAERSRALREGQIAEGLRHKNIVETLEVIPGEHEVFLITEFVHGMPLDEAARVWDAYQITDALAQVLEALVYAHGQGIIHRDIKPQNALVDARGRVKLTDFGVAYRAGDTRLTRVGFAVGTPGYIAPEILDGHEPSALTDIYAVGATARTLLSHQPYEPPPRLKEFVDRATSPNPAHRPQSAWAAAKLLTGRKAPYKGSSRASAEVVTTGGSKAPARVPRGLADGVLRLLNGGVAAWLGYALVLGPLGQDGAVAAGAAAGLAVLGYMLPRLAALGVVVALAVMLLQATPQSLGFAALLPVVGGLWVGGAGSASRDVGRLPFGPLLAVPLAAVGLAAALPFLLGALMRPLAAALSSAVGMLALVVYDVVLGDRMVPFIGGFNPLAPSVNPEELVGWLGRVLAESQVFLMVALWAAMALMVSLGEWSGRWLLGLVAASGLGLVACAATLSGEPQLLTGAVTSLGLAAIMYGVLRYLASRARG